MNQTMKAIKEAEAYPGPSLIIAYSPCINHGIKGGMTNSGLQQKKAVEADTGTFTDIIHCLRKKERILSFLIQRTYGIFH